MTIQPHADDRRTMVQKISEHLQAEARYQGPPTFSYAIGPVTVERDSSISSEDAEVLETLKPFLVEHGFIEPEIDALAISVPTEGMDGNQLRNLIYTLYGYQHLLNRVTRRESFSISEAVTMRLGEYLPETLADFETLMGDFKALGDLTGVDFQDGTVTLGFPLDEAPEKNRAYADLASAMMRAAREAKRVNAEVRRPEKNINILHVMANESFAEFADTLQKEIEQETGVKFGVLQISMFCGLSYTQEIVQQKTVDEAGAQALMGFMVSHGYSNR